MAYTTIDDPSKYFQMALYTGNQNASVAVVNTGNSDLQPDWVWGKNRDGDSNHWVVDSSRGVTKTLFPDITNAEETQGSVNAFNTDGFTLGDWIGSTKTDDAYVAWQWKANGGTTTTNDASSTSVGNTDSVIQANTEAGFSIVTFSGTGTGMTIAHGLGGTPEIRFTKARNATQNWVTHTTAIDGSYDFVRLSETDVKGDSSFTAPTSTIFYYSGENNYVAYCFRSIQGYSKIGSYTGNGNADGAFVYTGFKPAWVIIKRTDSANEWRIYDHKRASAFNPVGVRITAESSAAESVAGAECDFLSNGIKIRSNSSGVNSSGGTYIYMAFAEHPFVSSKGVPVTAR